MSITSIVATIGPATRNPQSLKALREAGMTVARLNGSHADLNWHRETIELLRAVVPDVPVLLDIPGRKIRTTLLAHEPSFDEGGEITLTTDADYRGNDKVPVNYDELHTKLRPGIGIYADDGTLAFDVLEIRGRDIRLRARAAGTLRSRKGINVPELDLGRDLLTPRDEAMVAFCKETGVDFVGISFVEGAAHVEAIRNLIGGTTPRIVAKVENRGGLQNLEEIARASDVIMIDRGDLSVETGVDEVSVHQKHIIEVSTRYARPVIVATELLHSMIENPLPTKAEIGDITNAILDGAAAVMLSGETAIGRYPVECVARLRSIATVAEIYASRNAGRKPQGLLEMEREFAQAVKLLAQSTSADKIVVSSRTGLAARLVAMERIGRPIVAVTDDEALARSLRLLPGTSAISISSRDVHAWDADVLAAELLSQGVVKTQDVLLLARFSANGTSADTAIRTVSLAQVQPAEAVAA